MPYQVNKSFIHITYNILKRLKRASLPKALQDLNVKQILQRCLQMVAQNLGSIKDICQPLRLHPLSCNEEEYSHFVINKITHRGGLREVSGRRGLKECEYLLIRHITATLQGEGQSAVTVWYIIGKVGFHQQVVNSSHTSGNLI